MPAGHPMQDLRLKDIMAAGKKIADVATSNAASRMRAIAEHAQASDGILFSTFGLFVGQLVAQELRKPAMGLWFQPITPTREFPSPMLPPMKLPGWLNHLSYRMLRTYLWRTLGRPTSAARQEVFGARSRDRPTFNFPILYGISRHLVAQPSDWPPGHCMCGHWYRSLRQWRPPEDLMQFLSAGPPPIYV